MECNKEEAIRAKTIAEAKMLNKDFTTARKIISKAQKLFPDLENVSHMLTVCEVHCAAEVKINGEMDWYGILQVPQNADESTIKKQYRKLALLLHPDKNNFGGAEAAFKLIGEAQRTLTDRSKRGLFDMKNTSFKPVLHTFWTMCTGCKMKYQYYAEIKDRTLSCQNCKKSFVARDVYSQAAPSAAPWNRSGFPGAKSNVFESGNGSKNDANLGTEEVKFEQVNLPGANKKTRVTKNTNQKRGKRCETVKLESSIRKKSVRKQEVLKDEVIIDSDDDFESQKAKKPKIVDLEKDKEDQTSEETHSVSYPVPEFCDFGKDREESRFAANQIWAIYDNVDAMPRFYALIREVYAPKFKLRFNWLEYDPTTKDEALWVHNELPTGAGKFKLGKTEHTQEPLMFSHIMTWNRSIIAHNFYKLYPRKGEVWALFKNWDMKLSLNKSNSDSKYEYEVVEVLSEFSNSTRYVTVVRLVKIQDFVSLFMQDRDKGLSMFNVELKDLLRFSHKVPSYRVVGREKEGVPLGCLELDSASLPLNFSETFPSVNLNVQKSNNSDGNSYTYPESEFHNFEVERSADKFKEGQIWALYSEVNRNPNYYAIIAKIEKEEFKVHITWLEGYAENENERHWLDEGLPFGCGAYITDPEALIMDSPEAFSHAVSTCIPGKNSTYSIHPCVGEVWALYKNWTDKWALLDLEKSDFELVKVLNSNGSGFQVSALMKVSGYKAVFKNTGKIMEIEFRERLRFSHRIPAFKLGEERGGKLRGCMELDPAAVPEILMRGS